MTDGYDTERWRRGVAARLTLLIPMLLAFAVGLFVGRDGRTVRTPVTTDTLVIRDTLVEIRPVAVERMVVRMDTVRLAVPQRPDTVVVHDTVEVELPILFSRYRGDNYDIGVSGFRTELEYVRIFPETRIVTKEIHSRQKKWGFGVSAGASVLITPAGKVRAGVGVTGGVYLRL